MTSLESIGYFTTKNGRRAYLIKGKSGYYLPKFGEILKIDGKEKLVIGLDDSLSDANCYTSDTFGIEVDESAECQSIVK